MGRRKKTKVSEQQVAEVVVAWLEALEADVYQEVTVRGGVADIVAKVGAEIWIIEVKTSLSLALLVQAFERRQLAHRVYVAAPRSKTMWGFKMIAEECGIGVMEVRTGDFDGRWESDQPQVEIRKESRRWNKRPVKLASQLSPEHKTHAKAGSIGAGGRWTPFRNTCEQVIRHVKSNPGCTIKEVVDSIKHHYASNSGAKSSLVRWIIDGVIKDVKINRENGKIRLYPVGPRP